MRCRMSRPRRPRLRFMESAESATNLEFAQDELRDHEPAIQETSLGNIGDAAVDNYAGVQDFESLLARLLAAEVSSQGG